MLFQNYNNRIKYDRGLLTSRNNEAQFSKKDLNMKLTALIYSNFRIDTPRRNSKMKQWRTTHSTQRISKDHHCNVDSSSGQYNYTRPTLPEIGKTNVDEDYGVVSHSKGQNLQQRKSLFGHKTIRVEEKPFSTQEIVQKLNQEESDSYANESKQFTYRRRQSQASSINTPQSVVRRLSIIKNKDKFDLTSGLKVCSRKGSSGMHLSSKSSQKSSMIDIELETQYVKITKALEDDLVNLQKIKPLLNVDSFSPSPELKDSSFSSEEIDGIQEDSERSTSSKKPSNNGSLDFRKIKRTMNIPIKRESQQIIIINPLPRLQLDKRKTNFQQEIKKSEIDQFTRSQIQELNQVFKIVIKNSYANLQYYIENEIKTKWERKDKINQFDTNNRTCLMYALFHQNEQMIEYLLRNGAETLYQDHFGRTPLHYAVKFKCSKSILKMILDYNLILDKEKGHIKDIALKLSAQSSFRQVEKGIMGEKKSTFSLKRHITECENEDSEFKEHFLNRISQRFFMILNESDLFENFELKYRDSQQFKIQRRFLQNLYDRQRMTPLHEAVIAKNYEITKFLLEYAKCIPIIRDKFNKTPKDYAQPNSNIFHLIDKHEHQLKEDFKVIMKIQSEKLKHENEQSMKKVFFNEKTVKISANHQLQQFIFGIYKDNALTYCMRNNNRKLFHYMIERGINPLLSDKNFMTTIHHAVELEKLDYLHFLLFGTYGKPKQKYMMEDFQKQRFILQSWLCLDQFTKKDGLTPLMITGKIGNRDIFKVIQKLIKHRDKNAAHYQQILKSFDSSQQFRSLNEHFTFTNTSQQNIVMICAYSNHLQLLKDVIETGQASIYTTDIRLNNLLHYAVINQNPEMIKYLLSCDAENNFLKKEINNRGQRPFELDYKKSFVNYYQSIWEICASCQPDKNTKEKLAEITKNDEYFSFNDQTSLYRNTPLHFSLLGFNFQMTKYLLQVEGVDLFIMNSDGLTAKDLMFMLPSNIQRNLIDQFETVEKYIKSPPSRNEFRTQNTFISKKKEYKDVIESTMPYLRSKKQTHHFFLTIETARLAQPQQCPTSPLLRPIKHFDSIREKQSGNDKQPFLTTESLTPQIPDKFNTNPNSPQRAFLKTRRHLLKPENEIYKKFINGRDRRVSQFTSSRTHVGSTHVFDESRKAILSSIFHKMDSGNRGYIKLRDIKNNQHLFQEYADLDYQFNIEGAIEVLERNYEDTKLTLHNFINAMNIYKNSFTF